MWSQRRLLTLSYQCQCQSTSYPARTQLCCAMGWSFGPLQLSRWHFECNMIWVGVVSSDLILHYYLAFFYYWNINQTVSVAQFNCFNNAERWDPPCWSPQLDCSLTVSRRPRESESEQPSLTLASPSDSWAACCHSHCAGGFIALRSELSAGTEGCDRLSL